VRILLAFKLKKYVYAVGVIWHGCICPGYGSFTSVSEHGNESLGQHRTWKGGWIDPLPGDSLSSKALFLGRS
jgi:hypothetical protein